MAGEITYFNKIIIIINKNVINYNKKGGSCEALQFQNRVT